ncbi:MAG: hypothetical protein ACE5GK_06055 [Nitrospiria bacterium]
MTIGKNAKQSSVGIGTVRFYEQKGLIVQLHNQPRAEDKLEEVTRKTAQMKRIQRALKRLIPTCLGEGPLLACSVIEALEDPVILKTREKRMTYYE